MTVKIGVVMDPIQSIKVKKDTTLAMLLAAQRKGWELYYMLQTDLYLDQGQSRGLMAKLIVRDDPKDWFTLAETHNAPLAELDVILMRKIRLLTWILFTRPIF